MREHRDLLKADFAVTADGPLPPSGKPTVKLGSRGVISFDLGVKHANRDVHSGNFGGVVPNPLWTLVHLLATMKNDRGEITIDGLERSSQRQLRPSWKPPRACRSISTR